jgi:enoyl-CoA hydratase/carnithine racemase
VTQPPFTPGHLPYFGSGPGDTFVCWPCDMSFASREKTVISQWQVGVGMVAGGRPMAGLPQLIGHDRALDVILSSEDIGSDIT